MDPRLRQRVPPQEEGPPGILVADWPLHRLDGRTACRVFVEPGAISVLEVVGLDGAARTSLGHFVGRLAYESAAVRWAA